MKILFIGGYGNISWHCTKKAIEAGHDVYLLNRDLKSGTRREIPKEAKIIKCDYRNQDEVKQALKDECFDVVCDFICYNGKQAKDAVRFFENRTKQYIVTSSEVVYDRHKAIQPFREDSPKYDINCAFGYIKGKLELEEEFKKAESRGFPVTIVRPGYTYDTIVPVSIGHNCFTAPKRYLENKPVLIAGDGEKLWTFTHSRDFAKAYCALIGNKKAIGESFHITGDYRATWNHVTNVLLKFLNVKNPKIIHIPDDELMALTPKEEQEMLNQKLSPSIFDNSKIKSYVPNWRPNITIEEGLKETLEWLFESETRRRINPKIDEFMENLTMKYTQKGLK